MRHHQSISGLPKTRGAVLFVALIMLLLITLLALTASSTSILQERMTSGVRNEQMATQGAIAAIRAAQVSLWNKTSNTAGAYSICGDDALLGCYTYPSTQAAAFRNPNTTTCTPNGVAFSTYAAGSGSGSAALAGSPTYIVEDLGRDYSGQSGMNGSQEGGATSGGGGAVSADKKEIYRITACSMGGNPNTVRLIESTFVGPAY